MQCYAQRSTDTTRQLRSHVLTLSRCTGSQQHRRAYYEDQPCPGQPSSKTPTQHTLQSIRRFVQHLTEVTSEPPRLCDSGTLSNASEADSRTECHPSRSPQKLPNLKPEATPLSANSEFPSKEASEAFKFCDKENSDLPATQTLSDHHISLPSATGPMHTVASLV